MSYPDVVIACIEHMRSRKPSAAIMRVGEAR